MQELIETGHKISASLANVAESHTLLVEFDLAAGGEQLAALEQTLSKAEIFRADRFITPDLRRRFVVCRGALRTLLGTIIGQDPSQVQFREGRWGKPALLTSAIFPVEFNVSNSGEKAAIAFSNQPVGVDLECIRGDFRHRTIASQVLSPSEEKAWNNISARDRDQEMMRLWVCKEALLKAMGLGIAEGLRQTSFPLPIPTRDSFCPSSIDAALQMHLDDDGTCRSNHFTDATAWEMQVIEPGPEYFLSTAISASRARRLHPTESVTRIHRIPLTW